MKIFHKNILKVILIIFIFFVVLAIFLYWQKNMVIRFVVDLMNSKLPAIEKIEYKTLSGNLLQEVEIEDLIICLDNGSRIKVDYLSAQYELFAMFSNEFLFSSILLDKVDIDLHIRKNEENEQIQKDEGQSIKDLLSEWIRSPQLDSLLSKLPVIDLGTLEILNGYIKIPELGISLDDFALKIKILSGVNDFKLMCEKLTTKWLEKNFYLTNMKAELKCSSDMIRVNKIKMLTPDSRIAGNIEISRRDSLWFIIILDDIFIHSSDIRSLFALSVLDSGFLNLSCEFVGSPDNFSTRIHMNGRMNEYDIDSLVIDGDYKNGEIILRQGIIFSNQSLVSCKGKFNENRSDIYLFLKNFNSKGFFPQTVQTNLNGTMSFHIQDNEYKNIKGSGSIILNQSNIDSIEFDTLRLRVRMDSSKIIIEKPSYLKMAAESCFHISGELSNYRSIQLNLSTEKNSISNLMNRFNINDIDGSMDANIFLSGDLQDPDLLGFLWLPELRYKDAMLDSTILQLQIDKIFSKRKGDARFSIARTSYNQLLLNETLFEVTFDSNRVTIDTLLFANYNNYITSNGYLQFFDNRTELAFNLFRIQYEGNLIQNHGTILLRFLPKAYYLEYAKFKTPDKAELLIRGKWTKDKNIIQSELDLKNIKAEFFKQFLGDDIDLKGTINGKISIMNPFTEPKLGVRIHGNNISFNKIPVGHIDCIFEYDNDQLYFSDFNLSNNESNIKLEGDIKVKFSREEGKQKFNVIKDSLAGIKISWNNIDIRSISTIFHLPRSLEGNCSGLLKLSGTLSEPLGSLELRTKNFRYDKFKSEQINMFSHFNKDSLILDSLLLNLNGTSFKANGWHLMKLNFAWIDTLIMDRPFELTVYSKDNKLNFLSYLFDQIESIQGPFETKLVFSGTFNRPGIRKGYFKIKDGVLKLSRVRNPITNFKINAVINNYVLKIKSLSGYSAEKKDFIQSSFVFFKRIIRSLYGSMKPEGIISATGNVKLANLLHPKVDLNINLYKFYIDYFIENVTLTLSTDNLHFYGSDTLYRKGDITITNGTYTPDMDNLKKNIYLTKKTSRSKQTEAEDINITIPSNFIISSSKLDLTNNFQVEIMGDLHSYRRPHNDNMELTGHLEILSGKYGSWGQIFEIDEGSIDFTNPKMINPEINMRAQKRSRQYIIELIVSGDLEKLQNSIQVYLDKGGAQGAVLIPNLTEEEKFNILSIGGRELKADSVFLAGEGVLNTSVETIMERSVEKYIGLDKFEIQSENKMIDIQSMKLNNGLKDASVSFGKYISNNLYLEYKSQFAGGTIPAPRLSWQPGNQIGLEYKINKNWSIDSEYLQTEQGNNQIKISFGWKMSFK